MDVATVKRTLRINHTLLDADIATAISEARLELVRAGVSDEAANGSDPLVERAILTYCQKEFSNVDKVEKYEEAFRVQLDNLRKTPAYNGTSATDGGE